MELRLNREMKVLKMFSKRKVSRRRLRRKLTAKKLCSRMELMATILVLKAKIKLFNKKSPR